MRDLLQQILHNPILDVTSPADVFFAFAEEGKEIRVGVLLFLWTPPPRSVRLVRLRSARHALGTESILKERKVVQTRDSSKSSQMISQGSHYASNIFMQETRKSLTISVSKQMPSSQSLGECSVGLCAVCAPSAAAPPGVRFIYIGSCTRATANSRTTLNLWGGGF